MTGSALFKNHNSIFTICRVIALCWFSLSGSYLENYWLEFNATSYSGQAQKEDVQCSRIKTPSSLFAQLLPFVGFPCPENNLKTTGLNSMQLPTIIKHNDRKCIVHEPLLCLQYLQSYCPLLVFLVWSITCKLLVGIQRNFIQWSSTITGSALFKNHNSIFTICRVIALCWFFLSGA